MHHPFHRTRFDTSDCRSHPLCCFKTHYQPPKHSFTNSQGFRFVISSHSCHRPVVLMSNYTSPSQCWMFPVAWIDCICDPLALLLSHWCWQRIVAVEISQHFIWVGNWYFLKEGPSGLMHFFQERLCSFQDLQSWNFETFFFLPLPASKCEKLSGWRKVSTSILKF